MKIYTTMPEGFCECPVCNGYGVTALRPQLLAMSYYGGQTQTSCRNCGGQYMNGTPQGVVRLQASGRGCLHSYTSLTVGRCLTRYTCQHCNEQYVIDSGD